MCARVCLLKVEAETWQWLIAWLRSNKHSLIKSSDSVKVYVSWESRGWTLCVNFHYYSALITAACLSCKCERYEIQLLLQLLGVNKNNFTIMEIFKDPFGRKCKRVTLNGRFCITVFHSQTQCFVLGGFFIPGSFQLFLRLGTTWVRVTNDAILSWDVACCW